VCLWSYCTCFWTCGKSIFQCVEAVSPGGAGKEKRKTQERTKELLVRIPQVPVSRASLSMRPRAGPASQALALRGSPSTSTSVTWWLISLIGQQELTFPSF
jgi:hypothetical protein